MHKATIPALAIPLLALAWREAAPEPAPPPLFEDLTEAAGFRMTDASCYRVAFADLDRDGWPDALIDRTTLWMNRPDPKGARGRRFARSEKDTPLQAGGGRRADVVQAGDVDNDGLPDLFLGRGTDLSKKDFKDDGLRSEIWLGDGKGGFALKKDAGVGAHAETTSSACLLDYDNDGILDLFVGNAYVAYGRSLEAFPDRLYRGKGDGAFEEVTQKAGLLGVAEVGGPDSRRPTYGVAHTDWNNDGRQDLLVMTYGRQANRLWRNNGDGTFTDVGVETTFEGDDLRDGTYPDTSGRFRETKDRQDEPPWRTHGNTFDCGVADFNGDGFMDCFLGEIAHGWGGRSSDPSMMLVNLGPEKGWAFRREPGRIPRQPPEIDKNQGDLHVGWMDADNDGRLDLLIASSDYPDEQLLTLYHQNQDGTFEDWTGRLGFKWVSAAQISLADFDRDGATDILVGTNHMRLTEAQRKARPLTPGLFRNLAAGASGNRFLSLRLEGAGKGAANRDAIGARVTVWTGEHRQVREVYGGLGHAGHRDDTECRFGMGKAEKADRVEVRWPDAKGTVQVFSNLPTNRFYTLRQGGTPSAR